MKVKKSVAIIIFFVIFTIALIYVGLTRTNKETNINLLDRQWISQNKRAVFDACILNDILVFTNGGEGIVFDFLEDVNTDLEINLNHTPYTNESERDCDLKFTYKKELEDKDFKIYEDEYVVVGKSKDTYTSSQEFTEVTIGVHAKEVASVSKYLNNNKISYKTFETYEELVEELNKEESTIDSFAVPKLEILEQLIKEELFVNYIIGEMKYNFVLEFGENTRLNEIINKYIEVWYENNFEELYTDTYNETYFSNKEISEKEVADFYSKSYTYGFVKEKPYDILLNGKPSGINSYIVGKFSKETNADIVYKSYDSYEELYTAFNENKIDFMVEQKEKKYEMDIDRVKNIYKNNFVVITDISNHMFINSLKSVTEKPLVIADSYVTKYLDEEKIKYTSLDNLDKVIDSAKDNSLIILDEYIYLENKYTKLKDYISIYKEEADRLDFIFRDIGENKVFNEKFSFFISVLSPSITFQEATYNYQENLLNKNFILAFTIMIVTVVVIIVSIVVLALFVKHKNKTRRTITKEDKLKYIDMLTALKNRNYLTDNIEEWDECDIYPQAVIVIDLNNVAYINDNFGHAEGDKVIKEAANILIKTQKENSELIRTSGNEFLVYLVGHEEKEIVAYKRMLIKELKKISHEFGAAIGYSMIKSGIKTIDDAVNEAALDMRNDKENQTY